MGSNPRYCQQPPENAPVKEEREVVGGREGGERGEEGEREREGGRGREGEREREGGREREKQRERKESNRQHTGGLYSG